MLRICENCKFWNMHINFKSGECRRYAPRVNFKNEISYTEWPWTMKDSWCGEFEEKESTQENG